jgi:hypothetical protein
VYAYAYCGSIACIQEEHKTPTQLSYMHTTTLTQPKRAGRPTSYISSTLEQQHRTASPTTDNDNMKRVKYSCTNWMHGEGTDVTLVVLIFLHSLTVSPTNLKMVHVPYVVSRSTPVEERRSSVIIDRDTCVFSLSLSLFVARRVPTTTTNNNYCEGCALHTT